MTSSLVGSEMCIRDRRWRTSWHLSSVDDAVDVRDEQAVVEGGRGQRGVCLLYTSDAADDM
eukprot:619411-Prorocentrum_lima.AAC.1